MKSCSEWRGPSFGLAPFEVMGQHVSKRLILHREITLRGNMEKHVDKSEVCFFILLFQCGADEKLTARLSLTIVRGLVSRERTQLYSGSSTRT